jgi:hypothetical protein
MILLFTIIILSSVFFRAGGGYCVFNTTQGSKVHLIWSSLSSFTTSTALGPTPTFASSSPFLWAAMGSSPARRT